MGESRELAWSFVLMKMVFVFVFVLFFTRGNFALDFHLVAIILLSSFSSGMV